MGRVVLASASTTRIRLLAAAGVSFDARAARIDERAVEKPLIESGVGPLGIAEALAVAKALAVVEEERGGALVLGVDQVLDCDGTIRHKPSSRAEAMRQLETLSGRSHWLHSAIAAVREGGVVWRHVDSAKLTMRKLSAASIEMYLDEVGEAALTSVGAYQLEGPGIRLFERIEGDYFTILGLPLLALLAFLRAEGEIAA
ncbi:MAG: Maf family protein [Bauldia sp.]